MVGLIAGSAGVMGVCACMLSALAVWMWPDRAASVAMRDVSRLGAGEVRGMECEQACGMEHGVDVMNDATYGLDTTRDAADGACVGVCGATRDEAECACDERARDELPLIGCVACVAALQASVRGGASLVHAFEELAGGSFAAPELTAWRISRTIRSRCHPKERRRQAGMLSAELHAVCQLSATLGCETGRCLDAVAASLRRRRLLDDLTANAFAMPQATVKLLMALPALTVLLGEGMGARPLAFLFGSRGLPCLLFAICCYVFGAIWIHALLKREGASAA